MAVYNSVEVRRVLVGKLACGGDLVGELGKVVEKENVSGGKVEAIGAVAKGRIGYYDQKQREYRFKEIDKALEIASLLGNVSMKEGKAMVHAHVVFAEEGGACYAGHLAEGTEVFACEFAITVCEGGEFVREYDEQTGLGLWREEGMWKV